ncbi:hypothetical protein GCM10023208_32930 [Erythrobacter westpacificensis]|uniref:Uncharacterized protein n=1 Tax=Erythrobacter westpacificensis TaxID=1055231 RepID=A0ABP9KQT1_9SPHN
MAWRTGFAALTLLRDPLSRDEHLLVVDGARYWEADFYIPRTARARHWLAQVSGKFIDLFGELRLVGRFSNGEAIFERSRSTCDSGS